MRIDIRRFVRSSTLVIAACVMAACGGGGGGEPAYSGAVVLSGTATFDSVPPRSDGNGLDYAATTASAIRGATVQLLDQAGQVLATTVTDAQGAYSFSMAAAQPVQVRVRAEMKAANGQWDFTVRDNTQGDALYALDSGVFAPGGATVTRDLRAASGWGGTSYAGTRAAGPFALLDTAYQGRQKILGAAPSTVLPALKIFWSVNNRPVRGSRAAGEIGTSFSSIENGGHVLYILGAANVDTDEYDTHVVAHEFGHYVTSALSRDDSPGGSHGPGDKLDMRLAFSEGFANAWSGMVLGIPVYVDTGGMAQAFGFDLDVSTPPVGDDRGWYSETTVQYLMWAAHQDPTIGFAPMLSALEGLRTMNALTSLYSYSSALKAVLPSAATSLDTRAQAVRVFGTDRYGSGESNDGGNPLNLPVYRTHAVGLGVSQQYCVHADVASSDGNKLGYHLPIRFTTAGAGARTLTVTRDNAATTVPTDPDFLLITSTGAQRQAVSEVADSETLSVTLSAGTHVLALQDYSLNTVGVRCFNFRVD